MIDQEFIRLDRSADQGELLRALAAERVLLLGIPGSGKTTTSNLLRDECPNFNYISLGDISRNLQPESEDAKQLRELFKAGQPSGLASFFIKLVDPHIREAKDTGFILDGIPKTPEEVPPLFEYMKKSLETDFSLVLHLQASSGVALGRIALRGTQDKKDSETMYQRRIAQYEPTVQTLYEVANTLELPWINISTDTEQPGAVAEKVLGEYAKLKTPPVIFDRLIQN